MRWGVAAGVRHMVSRLVRLWLRLWWVLRLQRALWQWQAMSVQQQQRFKHRRAWEPACQQSLPVRWVSVRGRVSARDGMITGALSVA